MHNLNKVNKFVFKDTSHNKNIMTITLVAFNQLLCIALKDTSLKIDGKPFEIPKGSSFGVELLKIFAKSAVDKSGKQLVNIAVSSLKDGGLSYVIGLIKQIKETVI